MNLKKSTAHGLADNVNEAVQEVVTQTNKRFSRQAQAIIRDQLVQLKDKVGDLLEKNYENLTDEEHALADDLQDQVSQLGALVLSLSSATTRQLTYAAFDLFSLLPIKSVAHSYRSAYIAGTWHSAYAAHWLASPANTGTLPITTEMANLFQQIVSAGMALSSGDTDGTVEIGFPASFKHTKAVEEIFAAAKQEVWSPKEGANLTRMCEITWERFKHIVEYSIDNMELKPTERLVFTIVAQKLGRTYESVLEEFISLTKQGNTRSESLRIIVSSDETLTSLFEEAVKDAVKEVVTHN